MSCLKKIIAIKAGIQKSSANKSSDKTTQQDVVRPRTVACRESRDACFNFAFSLLSLSFLLSKMVSQGKEKAVFSFLIAWLMQFPCRNFVPFFFFATSFFLLPHSFCTHLEGKKMLPTCAQYIQVDQPALHVFERAKGFQSHPARNPLGLISDPSSSSSFDPVSKRSTYYILTFFFKAGSVSSTFVVGTGSKFL